MPLRYLNRSNSSTTISAGNSVQFNGSNQYLTLFGQNLSTGNFTIESWVYLTATGTNGHIFNFGTNGSNRYMVWISNTGKFNIGACVGGTYTLNDSTFTPSINTWYHVAYVRGGSTSYLYVNGTQVGTNSAAIDSGTAWCIGTQNYGPAAGDYWKGYISNFRVVNGTAVYTASFSVPTSPLTAISNTSLLTCNAATIVDSSTNNFTITNNGSATVSSTVPFAASIAQAPNGVKFKNSSNSGTPTATGKSVQFDGSNQYLSVARILDNSTDVTIEAWVRATSTPPSNGAYVVSQYVLSAADRTIFGVGTDLKIFIQIGSTSVTSVAAITLNTWYHLAWVRSGSGANNFSIYINGVIDGQMTYTGTFQNTPTTIGGTNNLASTYFPGYISNLRILKGTALYTGASFTPPTAPLTAIANTSLLTCNAATIIDGSTNNFTITNNNSAAVSSTTPFTIAVLGSTMKMRKVYSDAGISIITSGLVLNLDASNVSSYPGTGTSWFDLSGNGNTGSLVNGVGYNSANGGSLVFDGSNDYVIANNTSLNSKFSTTSFSHFTWVYPTGAGILVAELGQTTPNIQWHTSNIEINASAAFSFSTWHNSLTSKVVSSNLSFNTWYYLGFNYDGTTLTAYINGTSIGTATFSRQAPYNNGYQTYYALFTADGTNMGSGGYGAGRCAAFSLYNRSLSESEVLQNYNATKAKFGL